MISNLLGTVSNIRSELEALENMQQHVFAAQKQRLKMVEAQLDKAAKGNTEQHTNTVD